MLCSHKSDSKKIYLSPPRYCSKKVLYFAQTYWFSFLNELERNRVSYISDEWMNLFIFYIKHSTFLSIDEQQILKAKSDKILCQYVSSWHLTIWICRFLYFINLSINWHERSAFQRLAFGRSTAGNDVVATIFIRVFYFFPPFFFPRFFLRRDLFT